MKSGASDPFGDESDDEETTPAAGEEEPEESPELATAETEQPQQNGESGIEHNDSGPRNDGSGASRNNDSASRSSENASGESGNSEGRESRGDSERRDGGSVSEGTSSGGSARVSDGNSGAASESTRSSGTDSSLDRSQIPYTLRRENVKDERPHVHQLFVTDDTDAAARETERDLEDLLDTDIYRLDAREAIYRIGMRHPEEVADLLEEWGYNF